jgi:peptidoglycan/xylan/chitin deacetylase (PgdA/CDA1 family)
MQKAQYTAARAVRSVLARASALVSAAPANPAVISSARQGVVSFCFDDAPESAARRGGGIVADAGGAASYFLCMGLAGGRLDGRALLSAADAARLIGEGHELGCHTSAHVSALEGTARFSASIEANAAALAALHGGRAPEVFAYPHGHVTPAAKRLVGERFAAARGVHRAINLGSVDAANLGAYGLEARRRPRAWAERLFETTAERGGWTILYTHDVSDDPSPYGVTPGDLGFVLWAARMAGLRLMTVSAAARAMMAAPAIAPTAAAYAG